MCAYDSVVMLLKEKLDFLKIFKHIFQYVFLDILTVGEFLEHKSYRKAFFILYLFVIQRGWGDWRGQSIQDSVPRLITLGICYPMFAWLMTMDS